MLKRNLFELIKSICPLVLSIVFIIITYHTFLNNGGIVNYYVWIGFSFLFIFNAEIIINKENFENLLSLSSIKNIFKAPAGTVILVVVLFLALILYTIVIMLKFILLKVRK